jgi:hypothetical protein
MRIDRPCFNIYLLLLVVACGLTACSSTRHKKNFSALRIHLETNRDGSSRSTAVPVYREKSYMVNIESAPFLTEGNVSEASVVEAVGGFGIELKFERRGAWLLETYSTANRGRRFAIFAEFQDPENPKTPINRWIAAPLIQQRITNGTLTFTPDASRAEAEEFVKGLNRLAKKLSSSWIERQ